MKKSITKNVIYKIRTSMDNKDNADLLAKALVNTKAAVSVHIKEVDSTYAWEGRIDNMTEYEVEALCIKPEKVKEVIYKYHNYKLPEFIVQELTCSDEIFEWCNDYCG